MMYIHSVRYFVLSALAFFVLAMDTPIATAQKETQRQMLPQRSHSYLIKQDPLSNFNLRNIDGQIIDADLSILRAGFDLSPDISVMATPEATARAWVDLYGKEYGITSSKHLEVIRETGAHGVRNITFQQVFAGIPVYRRYVHVNLGLHGLPTMVQSGYAPHLERVPLISTDPALSENQAQELAGHAISSGKFEIYRSELRIFPEPQPRLIWRIHVSPAHAPGAWEVIIDAQTGELIQILDQLKRRYSSDQKDATLSLKTRMANGQGLIWDPDPITYAGVQYGGNFQDLEDADNDSLNNQRFQVTLQDITQGTDDLYRLIGPYVEIDGTIDEPWNPPALAHPDSFLFTRSNDDFEAVMVYYHIDASQRYVQSLNIGRDIQATGVRANPHGLGDEDNSWYYPPHNAISFGDGGVDDAEDVEVILHEYAHALLADSSPVPIYADDSEGGAYEEGFADYWAVSYTRSLMESGRVPRGDWRQIFDWDAGQGTIWRGRMLDDNLKYPDDATCISDPDAISCNIYRDGVIWANAMMSIWEELGREATDRLLLFSHAYFSLSPPFTMQIGAEALLQADRDLYQGQHGEVIKRHLLFYGYPTKITRSTKAIPVFTLHTNYPNPFTGVTTISYTLDKTASVRIEVFNVLGQRVHVLLNTTQPTGTYSQTLDLTHQPAGTYLLRITANSQQHTKPLILVR